MSSHSCDRIGVLNTGNVQHQETEQSPGEWGAKSEEIHAGVTSLRVLLQLEGRGNRDKDGGSVARKGPRRLPHPDEAGDRAVSESTVVSEGRRFIVHLPPLPLQTQSQEVAKNKNHLIWIPPTN